MIGLIARTIDNTRRVKQRAKAGNYRSLGHAAASIRTIARRSIRKRKKPSSEGTPPSTQTRRIKQAILYALNRHRDEALIGTARSIVGEAGSPHEHGGYYKGAYYPRRSFMYPALRKAAPRLPKHWAGAVRT